MPTSLLSHRSPQIPRPPTHVPQPTQPSWIAATSLMLSPQAWRFNATKIWNAQQCTTKCDRKELSSLFKIGDIPPLAFFHHCWQLCGKMVWGTLTSSKDCEIFCSLNLNIGWKLEQNLKERNDENALITAVWVHCRVFVVSGFCRRWLPLAKTSTSEPCSPLQLEILVWGFWNLFYLPESFFKGF